MELFSFEFIRFTIVDLIDVLVVGFIFYKSLSLLKGTRAAQMATGLTLLFVVSFFAYWFQLKGMMWLFSNLATVGFIILVIVFQPEIRGALARLGYSRMLKFFYRNEETEVIDDLSRAVLRLAALKHGALIVIERSVGLKNIIDSGRNIDAKITSDIITTIFTPYTPLHDGAIVIRSDMIVAAGCMLPLSHNPAYLQTSGMRHKAGVGITEESDALCIIVSEETGNISIARDGLLNRNIEPVRFEETLSKLLNTNK